MGLRKEECIAGAGKARQATRLGLKANGGSPAQAKLLVRRHHFHGQGQGQGEIKGESAWQEPTFYL